MFIKSKSMLNLDSEETHAICIGCAGGVERVYYMEGLDFIDKQDFINQDI